MPRWGNHYFLVLSSTSSLRTGQTDLFDLEALLQPGALEARIEQVCLKVLIFSEAVFWNREVKRTTFSILVVKILFTCRFLDAIHSHFLSVAIFSF